MLFTNYLYTPEILNKAQFSPGDEVFITVRQGEIIIKLDVLVFYKSLI